MKKIIIKSNSKINFGLFVTEKRADNFHNIETIFYPIDFYDELTFEPSEKFYFSSNDTNLNNDTNNLIVRTKELLEKETNKQLNVSIHLDKNIPIGSGLGGGSSNAAVTLLSLNEMFNLNLSKEKLAELALQLGSDVPFFLNPFPSYAQSRGEKLKIINITLPYSILIINPGINVSTKWAYQNIKPKQPEFNLEKLSNENILDVEFLRKNIKNDFENVVFPNYPLIKNIKIEVYEIGADFSLMSGSGSTLFALFKNIDKALEAEKYFKQNYFTFLQEYDES